MRLRLARLYGHLLGGMLVVLMHVPVLMHPMEEARVLPMMHLMMMVLVSSPSLGSGR